jgi:hypothetical protein
MKKIPLRGEYGTGKFALVDNDDFEKLNEYFWHVVSNSHGHIYVRSGMSPNHKIMHRLIVNAKKGEQVDHINHNTFDNRKSNLRICTHAENCQNAYKRKDNSSGYKGVNYYEGNRNKKHWVARIQINGKRVFLGCYKTSIDAAKAYNEAAKNYHGEYALLNHLTLIDM